jgi:DNA mismatch endonuclease (patch repair protein)
MRRVKRRDTAAELRLRSLLHARSLRYYVDRPPLRALRNRADVVFPRAKVAVFVDGCFWHGCPEHIDWPKTNAEWWREKIERNAARDRKVDAQLAAAGWVVIRVWEHDDSELAAERVEAVVRERQLATTPSNRAC